MAPGALLYLVRAAFSTDVRTLQCLYIMLATLQYSYGINKMSLNTTESINSTSYTQTTAYTGLLTEDKMSLNTTESINSTSYTQTTAYTGHLTEGETIALIATVTVALFLLLLSIGGIFYCISRRHKATLELDGRRGTIFEPFGRESWQTRSSRESGAYKSFDIISLDILKDTTTENRPVSLPENVDIQRISKGSTLSGAYRSFDDLENAQPDPRTQDYEGDRLENRISLSDFEGPVKRTTYVQSDQDKRHSFHDQSDNSSGVETLGRYDSKEKLGNSELLQDTLREIDNPLFSELFHFDH